jgi:hypothetical protein
MSYNIDDSYSRDIIIAMHCVIFALAIAAGAACYYAHKSVCTTTIDEIMSPVAHREGVYWISDIPSMPNHIDASNITDSFITPSYAIARDGRTETWIRVSNREFMIECSESVK